MYKTVSVCIVNWNGLAYLPRCLDSVFRQDYKGKVEIIIVDNFSKDGSLEYLENTNNGFRILRNNANMGFSYAHNMAIRNSSGEYVLPLNFDIFIEPNFISEMVRSMEGDQEIGIVSGKLYKEIYGKKSRIIDSTGILMKHCFMQPRGETEEDNGQYDGQNQSFVFGACGAAPLYRKSMLDDIRCLNEYFDEDFINYVEDVDLSWRAQLRGWKCAYNPNAIAYHERGSTRKNNRVMLREYLIYGFRNRYCAMVKNLPKGYWKKFKLKIIGREVLFLCGTIREVPYIVRLKALFRSFMLLKKMLKKRRIIQLRIKIGDDYMDRFLGYGELNLFRMSQSLCALEIDRTFAKLKRKSRNNG